MAVTTDALLAIRDHAPLRRPITLPNTIALATGAYVRLDTGIPNQHWLMRRIRLKQASGTAASWNLRFGLTSTFVDGEEYVKLRDTDTELTTATPINECVEQDDGWIVSDANGYIYMLVTFSTASDHVLSGSFLLEPINSVVTA